MRDVSAWVEDEAVERVPVATDVAVLGAIDAPPTSRYFTGQHQVTNYLIAFPRSTLWIMQDRGRPIVADPTVATIYNRGQVFSRRAIAPLGDRGDWFGLAEDLVREVVVPLDAAAADGPAPLRYTSARVSADIFGRQRRIMRLAQSGVAEPGELDESVIHLFADVMAAAYGRTALRSASPASQRRLVARARELIAATYTRNLTVRQIAAECGASTFHLCRTFRRHTGLTLSAYRRAVRLRIALGLVTERQGDISTLAFELGFASHSHFSMMFRREFGHPPRGG